MAFPPDPCTSAQPSLHVQGCIGAEVGLDATASAAAAEAAVCGRTTRLFGLQRYNDDASALRSHTSAGEVPDGFPDGRAPHPELGRKGRFSGQLVVRPHSSIAPGTEEHRLPALRAVIGVSHPRLHLSGCLRSTGPVLPHVWRAVTALGAGTRTWACGDQYTPVSTPDILTFQVLPSEGSDGVSRGLVIGHNRVFS
jgi:hypothetical protein